MAGSSLLPCCVTATINNQSIIRQGMREATTGIQEWKIMPLNVRGDKRRGGGIQPKIRDQGGRRAVVQTTRGELGDPLRAIII